MSSISDDQFETSVKSLALPLINSPMISPNSPSTDEKISMTKIFTNLAHMLAISLLVSNQNHSQCRVRRIRQRSTTPIDPNTHTTYQITHPDRQSTPEQRIPRIHVLAAICALVICSIELRTEHNRHDDTVDGDDFAEDDRDEIFCSDAWRADAAAENRGAGYEDTPVSIRY